MWRPSIVVRPRTRRRAPSRRAHGYESFFIARRNALLAYCTVAFMLSPHHTMAQCIDYGEYLHLAGSVDTPEDALGVAISSGFAYVAASASGLQVIDITNPQSPQIVGSADTPGLAFGVAVSGTHAYVADSVSGLQVIDITNSQSPQIVGSVDTPEDALGVAVSSTHAYVADYVSGLQVIDITNPESPQIV